MKVHIGYDSDLEDPSDWDGQWKLYSFNRRHASFCDPGDLDHKTIKRKLKSGLAFRLGYYEHGQCSWFLQGQGAAGTNCPWDSVDFAGLLVWEHKASDMGAKTLEDRAKDAAAFLETYTCWCNGEGYYYTIEDEFGETVDSCGGFYGNDTDYMLETIAEHVAGHEFEVEGDGAEYLEHKLRKLAESKPAAGSNPLAFL